MNRKSFDDYEWKHMLYGQYGLFKEKEAFQGINNSFVVCLQTKCRYFAAFPNCLDFASFLYHQVKQGMPAHYYEVIPGSKPVKMFFDIDGDIGGRSEAIVADLLDSIEAVWPSIFPDSPFTTDEVRIYSSHGSDKKSWHIVFPEVICENIQTADWLAKQFVQHVNEDSLASIDLCVYKKTQQFRFLLCSKYATHRKKNIEPAWTYGRFEGTHPLVRNKISVPTMLDEEWIIFQNIFIESCITYVTKGKKVCLPREEIERIEKRNYHFYNLSNSDFLPDLEGLQPPDGFRIEKCEGNQIFLIRVRPSFCDICQKVHEHENAYLRWNEMKRELRLYCWRSKQYNPGGSFLYLYIPKVEDNIKPENEEQKIEEITIKRKIPEAGQVANGNKRLRRIAKNVSIEEQRSLIKSLQSSSSSYDDYVQY